MNKVDQPKGKMVRHRFSCPGCGQRYELRRKVTSLGKKIRTWCPRCKGWHKVWVPDFISPGAPDAS